MKTKKCTKCEKVLPATMEYFYKGYKRKDGTRGLRAYCKECHNEWPKRNPEKAREIKRRWQKRNPEKVREANRSWQKRNPGKVREAQTRWRKRNPEKAREYYRDKVQANDWIWQNRLETDRTYARKQDFPVNTDLSIKRTCFDCKIEYPATHDHFYKSKRCKYGVEYICRECSRKRKRELSYRRQNPLAWMTENGIEPSYHPEGESTVPITKTPKGDLNYIRKVE